MNKLQADSALKKLYTEAQSLTPSAIITLFEIDATDLGLDQGVIDNAEANGGLVFRFHNNQKLGKTNIVWQGLEYTAAPIASEGWEYKAKGTFPTPRLSLSTNEEGIPLLSVLKQRLKEMDDLIGAKVTRIRTFAKYLDAVNFIESTPPEGFDPDPNVEYPRDVYYIDNKSAENKNNISFTLASLLDTEGVKLPGRLVVANKCVWAYRGHGCMYEYRARRVPEEHGSGTESWLPESAPPVANEHNERISEILGMSTFFDQGKYQANKPYNKGDMVFIEKNNIKYYFVCKVATSTVSPPNINYWTADICSKSIKGCSLRWKNINNGVQVGALPFGGFPSVNKTS